MRASFRFTSLLFLVIFPLSGWAQSTFDFPLPFDAASGSEAGYAVVNPTTSPALVSFAAYDQNGAQTGFSTVTLPPGGQVAEMFSDLFRSATVNGWVQVTSATSGLQAMMLGGNFVNQVDGTAGADPSSDQVFPILGDFTRIFIANPSPVPVNLNMRFIDASGNDAAPALSLSVSGFGYLVQPVKYLPYSGQQYAGTYVRLSGGSAFSATAMVGQYLISLPEVALYNGIDAVKAGTVLNFPHVASHDLNGVTYHTGIGITNLSNTSQTITLTFTPDSGFAQTTSFFLGAGGSYQDELQFPSAGYQSGSLQVQSNGPVAAAALLVQAGGTTDGIAAVQPQGTGAAALIFPQIANGGGWTTSLELANPTEDPAAIQVYAINPNGTLIGGAGNDATAAFTLNPGAGASRLLSDLIPQTRNISGGFVYVVTGGVPITAEETFQIGGNGGPIASVPAGGLPAASSFTPPAH